jgi:DNA-directed RNA polymerase specialized sigma24 family protein
MPLLDHRTIDNLGHRARTVAPPGPLQQELLRRATVLLPRDRLMVELAIRHGVSRRRLAEALGIPAGSVTRRLQKLGARLHDPLVVALLCPNCPLASEYRQLGIEHFLQGQSLRQLAELHRMTLDQVRRMITYIRGWHNGAATARRASL